MNNGLTFGLEGPNITGWWVNPKTGDKFNAIDSYFEDNQLLIKTADGRILNFNQIQNYVQTKAEDVDKITNNIKSQHKKAEEIPTEVLNELDDNSSEGVIIPDDDIFDAIPKTPRSLGNMNNQTVNPTELNELSIIQRALKNKPKPSVKGLIDWKDFPKKEIVMLMEMMDVPFETIVDYYVNSVNINEIVNNIKKDLANHIEKTLGAEIPEIDHPEEQQAKSTKKTSKKK